MFRIRLQVRRLSRCRRNCPLPLRIFPPDASSASGVLRFRRALLPQPTHIETAGRRGHLLAQNVFPRSVSRDTAFAAGENKSACSGSGARPSMLCLFGLVSSSSFVAHTPAKRLRSQAARDLPKARWQPARTRRHRQPCSDRAPQCALANRISGCTLASRCIR